MQRRSIVLTLTTIWVLATVVGVWAAPAAVSGDDGTPALQGPQAVFAQTMYKFEPLFEGDDVTHDFIVENRGDAPLVIKNIKPG